VADLQTQRSLPDASVSHGMATAKITITLEGEQLSEIRARWLAGDAKRRASPDWRSADKEGARLG